MSESSNGNTPFALSRCRFRGPLDAQRQGIALMSQETAIAPHLSPWAAKGRAMAIAADNAQTGHKMPKIVAFTGEVGTPADAGPVENNRMRT